MGESAPANPLSPSQNPDPNPNPTPATRSSIVSRAACIQQLGRISLRRGLCAVAESHLLQSLALYHCAYGQSPHINVAAVRVQLGLTYSAARRADEAGKQFSLALDIKHAIYGKDCDNAEIATTLQVRWLGLELVRVRLGLGTLQIRWLNFSLGYYAGIVYISFSCH